MIGVIFESSLVGISQENGCMNQSSKHGKLIERNHNFSPINCPKNLLPLSESQNLSSQNGTYSIIKKRTCVQCTLPTTNYYYNFVA